MKMWKAALLVGSALTCAFAQDSSAGARDLFLETKSSDPAVHHVGLRYTVLLVDPETRRSREMDPKTVFHAGDCLAVEFMPNRDGSLWAFNHGSSGAWQLLLPSPQMPEEADIVKAGQLRRIPTDYCFRLDDHPGTETFVLAITERPDDIRRLRSLLASPDGVKFAGEGRPAMVANSVPDLVESWQRLSARDLRLEKIAQPRSDAEPPQAVYVVAASVVESTRLVLEIQIRHE